MKTLKLIWFMVIFEGILFSNMIGFAHATGIDPRVLQELSQTGQARTIVVLNVESHNLRRATRSATVSDPNPVKEAQEAALNSLPTDSYELVYQYSHVPGLAMTVTIESLEILRGHPQVKYIQFDEMSDLDLVQAVPLIEANKVHNGTAPLANPYDGTGIAVAVLDTGINSSHVDFAGRIVAQACFLTGMTGHQCPASATDTTWSSATSNSAEDDHGHGTHVSGIIAANSVHKGVAPGAKIAAVKVCNNNVSTQCITSNTIAGLDWVLANHNTHGIKVVNMSLGSGSYADVCDSEDIARKEAIQHLVDVGITVFASTGNNSNKSKIGSPGCLSNTIAVGATNDSDAVATFSNSSPLLDILAPGVAIDSGWIGSTSATSNQQGTSMATPMAAGVAALMLDKDGTLTFAQIKSKLQRTGVSITDTNGIARPRVNAFAAVQDVDNTHPILQMIFKSSYLNNGSTLNFSTALGVPFTKVLSIKNAGKQPLNLTFTSISGEFSIVGSFPTMISVGGESSLTIQFNATTAGTHAGTLKFATDDTLASNVELNLIGEVCSSSFTISTTENFESGSTLPECWQAVSYDGKNNKNWGVYDSPSISAINGNRSAVVMHTTTPTSGEQDYLVLPVVNFSTATSFRRLIFKARSESGNEQFRVYATTADDNNPSDGPTVWTQVGGAIATTAVSPVPPVNYSYDLGSYVGKYYLAIQNISLTNGAKLVVDDVLITEDPAVDITPPTFGAGSPSVTNVTAVGFDLNVKSNEVGRAYYIVLPASSTNTPTSPTQIKNGHDSTKAPTDVKASGFIEISTINTNSSKTVNGLMSSTAYKVYVISDDSALNLENNSFSVLNVTTSSSSDNTPPDTTIDSKNPATTPTNSTSMQLTFSGTDNVAVISYECELDSGGFSACTSPKTYSSLSNGSHTVNIRSKDAAGNVDASPATYTWTVDATTPDTTIDSKNPATTPTNSTSMQLTFSGTDNVAVISYECELDSGGFSACISPKTYSSLSNGSHTVNIRAKDGVGNVDASPATYTWTVDATAPTVTITQASGQSDPSTNTSTVNFTATTSEIVTGFDGTDVTIGGIAGATTATVTGSGTSYNIAVTGMTNNGTVTVTIAASKMTDTAGNNNSASTNTDNSVTINAPQSLVINEIDYDNVGTDVAEFLEIKNISGSAINLSGYTVEFINDINDSVYRTVTLPNINLAANDYYVICNNNTTVANCDLDSTPNTDFIQNGTPDVARITQGSFVIDTVSYGGTASPAIFVETTGTTTVDSNTVALVSLSRYADGTDTGNNNSDFALKCMTPGVANSINASSGCYALSINDPTAVTEGNSGTATITFTVTLSHAAASNVTVNYATANDTATAGADYTATSGTLTFAAGETSKTIAVTVNGDQVDEGASETFKVNLSSPSNNAQLSATSGAIEGVGTIINDDTAGFTLSKTTASVNESGTTDTFTVVLDSKPTSDVVISVVSNDTGEVTATPTTLTFTTSNWNTAQTVTVTGVDDGATSDGNQTTVVTLGIVDGSSDDTFDSLLDKTVSVTTVDNDTPGITVNPTTLTVSEPSGTANFAITLNTQPTGGNDVSIPFTVSGACTTTATSPVTVTNASWSTGATITVTASDDNVTNGSSRTCTVTIGTTTSSDSSYNNLNPNDVTVTVTDNDTAGISGAQIGGSINVTEGGASGSYPIVLSTQPTGDVQVTITAGTQTQVSTDGTTFSNTIVLTFTSTNWNTQQTVYVKVIDDTTAGGNHTATITHAITGTVNDTNYPTTLTLGSVTINITDNDQAPSTPTTSTGSPNYTVIVQTAGNGAGKVEQTGLPSASSSAKLQLKAVADTNSRFVGWSERFAPECVGSNPTVTVTVNAIKTCIATFEKIPPKAQTINFAALPAKQLGDPDFSLVATATSGLTVTFNSTTPTICTVTQKAVHLNNSETCTIIAQQLGDNQYLAATPVSQSFNIAPRTNPTTGTGNGNTSSGSGNNSTGGNTSSGSGSVIPSQLRGISANGYVDQQPLIVGLFSGGKQRVLIRASGVFQDIDPKISVFTYPDRKLLASNDNWNTATSAAELQQKQLAPAYQTDAGMLLELYGGLLTVEMTAKVAGVAIVEVYDLGVFDHSSTSYAFKGISVNAELNDYPIIAGLLVMGDKKRMLLRAIALETGIDPELEAFSYPDRRLLAANHRWATSTAQLELQQKHLVPPRDTDAATVTEFSQGLVTVEVTKATNSQSGRSIVEIYEMTAFQ